MVLPAMKGVREGFIGILKKELPHPESLSAFHCILHQKNLAAKSATVGDTFNKVLEIVYFIRVNSTRHRQCYNKFFAVLNSVWLSPEMYASLI